MAQKIRYFARDDMCIFPIFNIFNFGAFLVLKLITCFFLEMPHFFMLVFPKMPQFQNQMGKKWGISGKNAYAITCKISPPHTFLGISRNPSVFTFESSLIHLIFNF